MKLSQGHHLAYCTNVHRGNNWAETFASLENHVMQVRKISARKIPMPLVCDWVRMQQRNLSQPEILKISSNGWRNKMPMFLPSMDSLTEIFMGNGSKEDVYRPDWTEPERLILHHLAFQIFSALLPLYEGSVKHPTRFVQRISSGDSRNLRYQHLLTCAEKIEDYRSNMDLTSILDWNLNPWAGLKPPRDPCFFNELFEPGR